MRSVTIYIHDAPDEATAREIASIVNVALINAFGEAAIVSEFPPTEEV